MVTMWIALWTTPFAVCTYVLFRTTVVALRVLRQLQPMIADLVERSAEALRWMACHRPPTASRGTIAAASSTAMRGSAMAAGLEDLFGDQRPGEPNEELGELKRALVVAAHPDDADFGAAGTACLLAQAGWTVRYVVATDGSKGSDDESLTPARLITTREQEQRDAAELLGVQEVEFLGFTDGELVHSRELLGAITRQIREFRPFAVYTHDPEPVIIGNTFVNHSDHRVTGLATLDAVYPTARDRLNFPKQLAEGLATHKVRELYLWGANEPNFEADISDVIERKIDALIAHPSQFPVEDEGFLQQMRVNWRGDDGRYVEAFRRVIMFT